jgi:hypothetical protein
LPAIVSVFFVAIADTLFGYRVPASSVRGFKQVPDTLPAVSNSAQFRNDEEIDWLDWTSQS